MLACCVVTSGPSHYDEIEFPDYNDSISFFNELVSFNKYNKFLFIDFIQIYFIYNDLCLDGVHFDCINKSMYAFY